MSDTCSADFCPEIIGNTEALKKVINKALRITPTDCTVLISGETGTGKELFARAFHRQSLRSRKPFVAVNCAAMSKELLESELFGHVQGAFTTALRNREGRFQAADGGTIFLDEIGELPVTLQSKLLRVLQFKEFSLVGESKVRRVDVRIVAATNADLLQKVREGTFRQDLYYRLNVVQLRLPPLRERIGDIDVLVMHFLAKAAARHNRTIESISEGALRAIKRHSWPGNIRELENAIEHAVLMCFDSIIEEGDLPSLDRMEKDDISDFVRPLSDDGIDLQLTLRKIEALYIQKALQQTAGNKNQAANLLGLNRTTLVEKLKRGLPEPTQAAV
ncbi:MAG: sigma-54-dependent Fis family transcriptional regulator [Proteobacteria bacterium]|nr:sigma-54-dependent Fis family transcriptional regulator [Pseudomonadota bacterium]